MKDVYIALHSGLIDLECELRNLNLWDTERPSEAALSSTEPFCIDTLSFPQWLQFIFIERIQQLIEARAALPEQCNIAPMAEEYFKGTGYNATELIRSLAIIDRMIMGAKPPLC